MYPDFDANRVRNTMVVMSRLAKQRVQDLPNLKEFSQEEIMREAEEMMKEIELLADMVTYYSLGMKLFPPKNSGDERYYSAAPPK